MGPNRLFIPQDVLDQWVEAGRADLRGRTLEVEGEGAFDLEPACHFLTESAGGDDPHGLVGRVKEQRALESLGAEAYMDSALVGDNAYDIRPGYLALPLRIPSASSDSEPVEGAGSERPERSDRAERADSDELAELLLKHLK